jgi:hypothetical protein
MNTGSNCYQYWSATWGVLGEIEKYREGVDREQNEEK